MPSLDHEVNGVNRATLDINLIMSHTSPKGFKMKRGTITCVLDAATGP